MSRHFFRQLLAPVCLLLATAVAPAFAETPAPPAKATEQDLQRVADYAMQILPFGSALSEEAAKDPEWPLTGVANKATPAQLACLRSELSEAGVRRRKLEEVRVFAAANPDTFVQKTKILETVAPLFGRLVKAGLEKEKAGVKLDPVEAVGDASAADLLRIAEFLTAPEHADVRLLVGVDALIGDDQTPEEQSDSARKKGESIGTKLVISAVDTCKLPASVLL